MYDNQRFSKTVVSKLDKIFLLQTLVVVCRRCELLYLRLKRKLTAKLIEKFPKLAKRFENYQVRSIGNDYKTLIKQGYHRDGINEINLHQKDKLGHGEITDPYVNQHKLDCNIRNYTNNGLKNVISIPIQLLLVPAISRVQSINHQCKQDYSYKVYENNNYNGSDKDIVSNCDLPSIDTFIASQKLAKMNYFNNNEQQISYLQSKQNQRNSIEQSLYNNYSQHNNCYLNSTRIDRSQAL